jgi:hypothetical protein
LVPGEFLQAARHVLVVVVVLLLLEPQILPEGEEVPLVEIQTLQERAVVLVAVVVVAVAAPEILLELVHQDKEIVGVSEPLLVLHMVVVVEVVLVQQAAQVQVLPVVMAVMVLLGLTGPHMLVAVAVELITHTAPLVLVVQEEAAQAHNKVILQLLEQLIPVVVAVAEVAKLLQVVKAALESSSFVTSERKKVVVEL